MMTCGAGNFLR